MLLRARTVYPVAAPPIEHGAVLVAGERIQAVGRWTELRSSSSEVTDLGDVILLPGLVNAHCHLDYTDMAGQFLPPRHFPDWIKSIVALKAEWSYTEFAQSWLNGARTLLRSGTTTVVDIEAVPELLPEVTHGTPLRVISCLELISVRSRHSAVQLVEAAAAKLRALAPETVGLSPHAPYTTVPELLRATARAAGEHGWLLTTHVAESADEFEMFQGARGAMFEWLKPQRDMSDCGACSPVAHLARHEMLGRNLLAVHANYLAPGDAERLGRAGASVAHCPRSHAFFGHREFPLAELQRAGVNVCLGTDSMATVLKSHTEPLALNLFSEMRALVKEFPNLRPEDAVAMATVNGARALNREQELGVLAPGAFADLIAVPHRDGSAADAIVSHRGDVVASMIRGGWVVPAP